MDNHERNMTRVLRWLDAYRANTRYYFILRFTQLDCLKTVRSVLYYQSSLTDFESIAFSKSASNTSVSKLNCSGVKPYSTSIAF